MTNKTPEQKSAEEKSAEEKAAMEKRLADLEAENKRLKDATLTPITAEQIAKDATAERHAQQSIAAEAMAKRQKQMDKDLAKALAAAPKVTNLSQTKLAICGVAIGIGKTEPVPKFKKTGAIKIFLERGVIKVA